MSQLQQIRDKVLAELDQKHEKYSTLSIDTPIAELQQILIDNPPHYTHGKYECIDIIEDLTRDWPGPTAFRLGNVIKYIWRHLNKPDDTTSLEKAAYYLKREIESNRKKNAATVNESK